MTECCDQKDVRDMMEPETQACCVTQCWSQPHVGDMMDPEMYQANEGQELLAAIRVAFLLQRRPMVQESCPHAHPNQEQQQHACECQLYVDDPQAPTIVVLQGTIPHITRHTAQELYAMGPMHEETDHCGEQREQHKMHVGLTWWCLTQELRTGAFILPLVVTTLT